ncbi:hypothetical protein, conserved [Eimeria maxima]|uniref:C3H1-type domain-containing protein n=1 Tax=Eimeria maxima TaxID=5804 RepID=U6M3H2_EIMMA|nr:hypothetical protein, conserved [Eimeria maxima]CDJ56994.1 hypothetical protein, conserved [Eimeria maxima]
MEGLICADAVRDAAATAESLIAGSAARAEAPNNTGTADAMRAVAVERETGHLRPSDSMARDVSVLADCLWHPAAAAAAAAAEVNASLLLSCLDAPEKVSIHFKDTVQPVLLPQQQHQQHQQQHQQQEEELIGHPQQHLLLRVRGIVTRQQSLGRRLCFFDIMPPYAIEAAAATAKRETASAESPARETAAAPLRHEGSGKTDAAAGKLETATEKDSSETASAAHTTRPNAPTQQEAASESCIALCCSVSSPDVGGLDVHRSILRRLRLGDSVEAVGVLERKGELQQHPLQQQLACKLQEAMAPCAAETALQEVTRVVGFKVLALRASRPAEAEEAAAVAAAAEAVAAATLEKAQRVHLLHGRPRAALPCKQLAADPATEHGRPPAEGTAASAAAQELSRVCKMYLLVGSCGRADCPLLHVRDGRLRRQFDLLKAQKQVRRVQQQLQQQQQQHLLLRELPLQPPSGFLGGNFSALTLQDKQQQQQQQQRIYPRSLRGAVFGEWLVKTYGVERLRMGSGVVEVGGGRGELAFELAVKYQIPTTIIDPRCTYTPKSEAAQPPDARRQWETQQLHAHSGAPAAASTADAGRSYERAVVETGDACLPKQAMSSAMKSCSRSSFECPLRLNRRQAAWLLQHRGLRGKEAEAFFRESVETIPALFNADLIRESLYVQEKLLTASALVGLHPDEAAGDIVDAGLAVHARRRARSNGGRNSSNGDRNNGANSGSNSNSNGCNADDSKYTPTNHNRHSRSRSSSGSSSSANNAITNKRVGSAFNNSNDSSCNSKRDTSIVVKSNEGCGQRGHRQQQQQTATAAELPDLVLAVVPCCVFSEIFPQRRVPHTAAEAAAVSPSAAAAAAAAVPAPDDSAVPNSSAAAAGDAAVVASYSASTAALSEGSVASSGPLLQRASDSTAAYRQGESPACVPVGEACAQMHHLALHGTEGTPGSPLGVPLFTAGAGDDGNTTVRTYEELLLWLHLRDRQRRLQQQTLPMVGKNQVIFMPP